MLLEKRLISPFLRDKSTISPKTVSDGEKTLPRIYKKILSCDTKLGSGTKSRQDSLAGEKRLILCIISER